MTLSNWRGGSIKNQSTTSQSVAMASSWCPVYLLLVTCLFLYFGSNYISVSKCGVETVSVGEENNGSLMRKSHRTCDRTGSVPCLYRENEKSTSLSVKQNKSCVASLFHYKLMNFLKKETEVIRYIALVFLVLTFLTWKVYLSVENILPETIKCYAITAHRRPFDVQYEVLVAALRTQNKHVRVIWVNNCVVCLSYVLIPLLYSICYCVDLESRTFFVPFACLMEHLERNTDADIFCFINQQNIVTEYFYFLDVLFMIMSFVTSFYVGDLCVNYVSYLEKYREETNRPEPVRLRRQPVRNGYVEPTFCEYLLIKHIEATDNHHLANHVKHNLYSCRLLQTA